MSYIKRLELPKDTTNLFIGMAATDMHRKGFEVMKIYKDESTGKNIIEVDFVDPQEYQMWLGFEALLFSKRYGGL